MGIGIDTNSPSFAVLDTALVELDPTLEWNAPSTCSALHVIRSLEALGHLSVATSKQLAIECVWLGDPALFIQMLIGSGWLICRENMFTLGPAWETGIRSLSEE